MTSWEGAGPWAETQGGRMGGKLSQAEGRSPQSQEARRAWLAPSTDRRPVWLELRDAEGGGQGPGDGARAAHAGVSNIIPQGRDSRGQSVAQKMRTHRESSLTRSPGAGGWPRRASRPPPTCWSACLSPTGAVISTTAATRVPSRPAAAPRWSGTHGGASIRASGAVSPQRHPHLPPQVALGHPGCSRS